MIWQDVKYVAPFVKQFQPTEAWPESFFSLNFCLQENCSSEVGEWYHEKSIKTNSACGTSCEFVAMVPAVNQENENEGMGNPFRFKDVKNSHNCNQWTSFSSSRRMPLKKDICETAERFWIWATYMALWSNGSFLKSLFYRATSGSLESSDNLMWEVCFKIL